MPENQSNIEKIPLKNRDQKPAPPPESLRIRPYPGLRPFNEQEALYFKGRDKHIEKIKKELGRKSVWRGLAIE